MKFIKTELDGVFIIEPRVFEDNRGYFFECYSKKEFEKNGLNYEFVQDNQSKSSYGTIRGLHFQKGEFAQAKLVRVLKGNVLDVAVDIRKGSPTFGKYVSVVLSAENGKQFYIPRGFAHGFIVLEDNTLFSYKCDNFYCPSADRGLYFNDPALNIDWPELGVEITLSEKDKKHPRLSEIEPWEEI